MASIYIGDQLLNGGTLSVILSSLLLKIYTGLPSKTLHAPVGKRKGSSSFVHQAEQDQDIQRQWALDWELPQVQVQDGGYLPRKGGLPWEPRVERSQKSRRQQGRRQWTS